MTNNELNEMRELNHQISIIADQYIEYTYNDMRVMNLSAKMYHKNTRIYQRSAFTIPFPVSTIESCLKIASQGLKITKLQIHTYMINNEKEI